MKTQKGFTLIELMIVVAIVGILAAIAIPAYIDYTVRAKVSEGIAALAPAKVAVAEYYISNSSMPANIGTAGFSGTVDSKYVNTLAYTRTSASRATITMSVVGGTSGVGGSTTGTPSAAILRGLGSIGNVDWDCEVSGTFPTKYLPANCRDGGNSDAIFN